MNLSSGTWAGIITVIAVVVGAPLATLLKGWLDGRLKRQDIEQADDAQIRADLKSERDLVTSLRQEVTSAREETDRERQSRVAEANANMARVRDVLAEVEKQQETSQRLLNDMDRMRQAHRAEMDQQRQAHRAELESMRASHDADLAEHSERISALEGWIAEGKPPPAPPWVRRQR